MWASGGKGVSKGITEAVAFDSLHQTEIKQELTIGSCTAWMQ